MAKSYPRSKRVADQIQRTLPELLRKDVRDPRLGSITITEVRVADDLSHARIFYTVLGSGIGKAPDAELMQEILVNAASLLRGRVGRALGLRHAPSLEFTPDTLIEEGARLSALINQAVRQDRERHIDDAADSAESKD